MKKRNFTLVEMLVVIAIIAVLAGLLLTAIGGVKEKAKKSKAMAECQAILTAIKSYETTYGVLPWGGGALNDTSSSTIKDVKLGGTAGTATDTNYETLIQWLTQAPTYSSGPDTSGNLRKIKFLDPASADGTKTYLDPWGNRYVIIMDTNYNGYSSADATNKLYGSVFVYSKGPNGFKATSAAGGDNMGLCKGVNSNSAGDDDIGTWHK